MKPAFTLIELLVVITIIVVLPVLGQAIHQRGRTAKIHHLVGI